MNAGPIVPAESAGIDGAPVSAVIHHELAAIVSAHEVGAVQPTEAALWQHEAVCEALMEIGPLLPAKFGVMFSGEDPLHSELASRYDELVSGLTRTAGRVELAVRAFRQDGSGETAPFSRRGEGAGRAYLAGRLAERRRDEALAETIHEALAPLAVASRRQVLAAPTLVLTAAYLVERELTDSFRRTVERLAADHGDISLLCTGPWPPYNFVSDPGSNA
jgi:hypothetical protein